MCNEEQRVLIIMVNLLTPSSSSFVLTAAAFSWKLTIPSKSLVTRLRSPDLASTNLTR